MAQFGETKRLFRYFPSETVFKQQKLAADYTNASYIDIETGEEVFGDPDVCWQDICFIVKAIADVSNTQGVTPVHKNYIYTHGQYFNCDGIDDAITLEYALENNVHGLADALDVATELTNVEKAISAVLNDHEIRIKALEDNDIATRLSVDEKAIAANTADIASLQKISYVGGTNISITQSGSTFTINSDVDTSTFKTKQTAKTDPSASGNSSTFISSITQNENGEITATKANVNFSDYVTKSQLTAQSYVTTSALANQSYVTKSDLSSQSYITPSTLVNQSYVTTTGLVNQAYVTKSDLSSQSYVTPSTLVAQSYVTTTGLVNQSYVTKSDLTSQSYVTAAALKNQSYVTETSLESRGYITAAEVTHPDYSATYTTYTYVDTYYATKDELAGAGIQVRRVDALPETGEAKILYFVPKTSNGTSDVYNEYMWMWTGSTYAFELIGSTQVDLTDYVKKQDLSAQSYITPSTLAAQSYVTKSDLSSQAYVTPSTLTAQSYVTQTTLSSQAYVTPSTLVAQSYVTTTGLVNQAYVTKSDLSVQSYVTPSTLVAQSYVTATALKNQSYVTATALVNQSYVTKSDLSAQSYVTETSLESRGYISSLPDYSSTYKAIQTAVSDPTASGDSVTFIDSISQNTQGVITATKKNVQFPDYSSTYQAFGDYKTTQSPVENPTASGTSTTFISYISQDANGEITVSAASIDAVDEKVKDTTSTSKGYILAHTSTGTTATAITNASVYMQNGGIFATGTASALSGFGISSNTNLKDTYNMWARTDNNNPILGFKAGSQVWYFQATSTYLYLGPTSSNALWTMANGNAGVPGSFTATKGVYTNSVYALTATNQSATKYFATNGTIQDIPTIPDYSSTYTTYAYVENNYQHKGSYVTTSDLANQSYVTSSSLTTTLEGYKTKQTAVSTGTSTTASKMLVGITQNANGEISYAYADVPSAPDYSSTYKAIQTAVDDPTAEGNNTAFISNISQDTQGVITVTKASVPDYSNTYQAKGNYKTTQTAVTAGTSTTTATKMLVGITQSTNGVISYAYANVPSAPDYSSTYTTYTYVANNYQAKGDYKTIQTAVDDPTASGNATAFIDTISQNTNGVITVTKKNVTFPDYSNTYQAKGTYITPTDLKNASYVTYAYVYANYTSYAYTAANYQLKGNYKTTQTAVSTGILSTTPTKYVNGISQDANGVISYTYNNLPDYSSTYTTYTYIDTYYATKDDLAGAGIQVKRVASLPATGESKILYFVPKSSGSTTSDVYDEYMWMWDSAGTTYKFELIGSTQVSLTDYVTKQNLVDQSYVTSTSLSTTLEGYKTKQTAVSTGAAESTSTKYVSGISQNANGEISYAYNNLPDYSTTYAVYSATGYKEKQTAVSTGTKSTAATKYINGISQTANGNISYTYNDLPDYKSTYTSYAYTVANYKQLQTAVSTGTKETTSTKYVSGISQNAQGVISYTYNDLPTDIDKKTSSENTTDKVYLVGAKSQSSDGVATYTYTNVWEQSGQLNSDAISFSNGGLVIKTTSYTVSFTENQVLILATMIGATITKN